MPTARKQLDARKLLLTQVDLGLAPEFDPALAQGFVESHSRCNRGRMAELQLPHDRNDGRSLERLVEHRQHLQLVLFADVLDVFEHRQTPAAHELDETEIAAFAECHDVSIATADSSPTLMKIRSGLRCVIAVRTAAPSANSSVSTSAPCRLRERKWLMLPSRSTTKERGAASASAGAPSPDSAAGRASRSRALLLLSRMSVIVRSQCVCGSAAPAAKYLRQSP